MIIKRELQNATWQYDEEARTLKLYKTEDHLDTTVGWHKETHSIKLTRVEAFSLARFLIRVFFRMSMKKRKVKNEVLEVAEPFDPPGDIVHKI